MGKILTLFAGQNTLHKVWLVEVYINVKTTQQWSVFFKISSSNEKVEISPFGKMNSD